MNERIKSDLRLLHKYLECDVQYNDFGDKIEFHVLGKLGDTDLPEYKILIKSANRDDESMEAWADMAIGYATQAFINLIQSTEASKERDVLNKGLAQVRYHEPFDEDKIKETINDFEKTDFRSKLNLIDNHFKGIKTEPDFDNFAMVVYHEKDGKYHKVVSVDRNSNVVEVIDKLKKDGYNATETFVTAVRNQIREFKEVRHDDLVAEKKAEQDKLKKEAKKNG